MSVDPLSPDYPWYTPYQFAGNKPIVAIDLDGLEEIDVNIKRKNETEYQAEIKVTKHYKVINLSSRPDYEFRAKINSNLESYAENRFSYSGRTQNRLQFDMFATKEGEVDFAKVDYSYKINYDIKFADNFDDIKSTDLVVLIIDDAGEQLMNEGTVQGWIDAAGFSSQGSQFVAIEASQFDKSGLAKTFAHEDGHQSSLKHACYHSCQNLMSYKGGSNLNEKQHNKIAERYLAKSYSNLQRNADKKNKTSNSKRTIKRNSNVKDNAYRFLKNKTYHKGIEYKRKDD